MLDSGFKRFDDVVVFVGGAAAESKPHRCWEPYNVTCINVTWNAIDGNALAGLSTHKNDPEVTADGYLHLLDTSSVEPTFPAKFEELQVRPDEVLLPPRPNAQILVFGKEVVENFGTNFLTNMSKQESIALEYADMALEMRGCVKNVEEFAHRIQKMPRRGCASLKNKVNKYNNSFPRRACHYSYWGITKYVNWGLSGEFTGNALPMGNWRNHLRKEARRKLDCRNRGKTKPKPEPKPQT